MSGDTPTDGLSAADTREAVRLSKLISDDQLAYWMLYPCGSEHTIDPQGFGVEMSPIGRAAFRHRLAVDPEAAAKCECWEGTPPAVALFKPAWRATPSKKNEGWLVVIGPFDEGFIRDVHSATENRWDHALKARLVHSRHADELDAIIEHHSLPVDDGTGET